jgi:uncharacterized cupredoxin-like copper-binding protein
MIHKYRLSLIVLIAGIFLTACGSTSSQRPIDVDINLKEFTVESSLREFKPGTSYHFKVTNAGQISHEFMIMPIRMEGMDMSGMQGMTMEERDNVALIMIPEAQLGPGDTVEVDYTFEKGFVGEGLEIVCTLPGHREAGMHMPITLGN